MKPVNIKKKYDIAYCFFVGVAFIIPSISNVQIGSLARKIAIYFFV